MATAPSATPVHRNGYPTSDGRALDSDWHRNLMWELIRTLRYHFAAQPQVYVSGNLLVFYEQGNRRRRVSPDVFVVKGVANHPRPNYLLWEERRGPQVVIELTSSSTRREDLVTKLQLYRDVLRVKEYFLFDPYGDYLDPPLQGRRLRQGEYRPIRPDSNGRLPSQTLGLRLERNYRELRLYDPATGRLLRTLEEQIAQAQLARQQAEAARQQAENTLHQSEAARQQAEAARQQAEAARQQVQAAVQQVQAEVERLRRELADLRNRGEPT